MQLLGNLRKLKHMRESGSLTALDEDTELAYEQHVNNLKATGSYNVPDAAIVAPKPPPLYTRQAAAADKDNLVESVDSLLAT